MAVALLCLAWTPYACNGTSSDSDADAEDGAPDIDALDADVHDPPPDVSDPDAADPDGPDGADAEPDQTDVVEDPPPDTAEDGPDAYPAYPFAAAVEALNAAAGVCHGEGSPWGYNQDISMMSISWRELDAKTVSEIADALGAYIDGLSTPTMLVVQMGGQTITDPPQPYYPPEKEDIPGYLLNVGSTGVTPDLAHEQFQADLDEFLGRYGPGMRRALSVPARRSKVLAVIGWLGSYSESYYGGAEPGLEELALTITKFYQLVGQVAELPVVYHVSGRNDLVDHASSDPVLSAALAGHHLWFKINGFHCATLEAGDCLSQTYAQRQADVLSDLRLLGSNVGWEPAHPEIWVTAPAAARQYAIDVSVESQASFACAQSWSTMQDVMTGLITGTLQAPEGW